MNLLRGRFFFIVQEIFAGFADFIGLTFGDKSRFLATFFSRLIPNFSEAFFLFLAVF